MGIRAAIISSLWLAALCSIQGADPQDQLDKTLNDHPEFDAQRPQRAVVNKVQGQSHPLEVAPPLDTPKKNLSIEIDRAQGAKRATLLTERGKPVKTSGAEKRKSTKKEIDAVSRRKADARKELRAIEATQPTTPPLS